MKKIKWVLIYVVMQAMWTTVSAENGPIVFQAKMKKLVVSDFAFAYPHDQGRPQIIAMYQEIGQEEGFEVVVVQKNEDMASGVLDDADVVVLQNVSVSDDMSANAKNALQSFVENGKGMLVLHGTMSWQPWQWLQDNAIYGQYKPHAKNGTPAVMRIDDEAYSKDQIHPILAGLGDLNNVDLGAGTINGWREEWFNWSGYMRGNSGVKILLNMDTDSYECNCPDIMDDHPALWLTEGVGPGKGKTAYFLAGHGNFLFESASDKGLKLLYRNSVIHLGGGYDTLGCTDPLFEEYNAAANIDNGSCITPSTGIKVRSMEGSGAILSNKLTVTFSQAGPHRVSITDVSGTQVLGRTGIGAAWYNFSGKLAPGVYMLEASSGNKKIVKRINLIN